MKAGQDEGRAGERQGKIKPGQDIAKGKLKRGQTKPGHSKLRAIDARAECRQGRRMTRGQAEARAGPGSQAEQAQHWLSSRLGPCSQGHTEASIAGKAEVLLDDAQVLHL